MRDEIETPEGLREAVEMLKGTRNVCMVCGRSGSLDVDLRLHFEDQDIGTKSIHSLWWICDSCERERWSKSAEAMAT